jgi:hypothetical protein
MYNLDAINSIIANVLVQKSKRDDYTKMLTIVKSFDDAFDDVVLGYSNRIVVEHPDNSQEIIKIDIKSSLDKQQNRMEYERWFTGLREGFSDYLNPMHDIRLYEGYTLLEMDRVTPLNGFHYWDARDNYRFRNQINDSMDALTAATEYSSKPYNYNEFDDPEHWGYNPNIDRWVCYDYA